MTELSNGKLRRQMHAATALSPLTGATGIVAALLLATIPAHGQSGPSPVPAPNPVVPVPGGGTNLDFGANGVPVVKIATPDARGTSYNKYRNFNVDGRGLVLNNSEKIVQSRLAGFIDGNAQLKTSGAASLIINEVVEDNPSRLAGYIEIAGQQADLVLANPYGISCDGCGFVNAPRVTLAAATPTLDGAGALTGFRATTGTISVSGRGLDATNARLELFARAVSVNAGLYADTVTASFGAGEVNRDGEIVVTGQRNPAQADQPMFGLDVAALGGMYARSIRLIGTEQGLGVNVSGELAGLEQGVTLSADGKVSVAGMITARTAVGIETAGALEVAGQIYAEGTTTLAATALTGNGLIGSGGDLRIKAGAVASGGTLAAGLARDGRVTQSGALTFDVAGAAALSGRVLAHDGLTLSAGAIVNKGVASGTTLTLRTGSLDNSGGVIDARTTLDAQAGTIANTGGAIQSGGALALTGSSLTNERGAVLALGGGGALTLGITGAIAGADGQIGGNGDVSVSAGALSVAGTAGSVTAAKALGVTVAGDLSIAGKGLIASGDAANVTVGGATAIAEGGLQAGGSLSLGAGAVTVGGGGRLSGATLTIASTGALTNAGLIASAGRVGVTAGAITNSGTIAGDGGLELRTAGAFAQDGLVASDAAIAINAGRLTSLAGTVEAGGALAIAAGSVALDRSNLLATGAGALTLASRGALSAAGSRLGGNGDVAITGVTIGLGGSRVTALGALTLGATGGDLTLGNAILENGGDLTLRAAEMLSHTADIIGRGRNLTLSAERIDNRGGAVLHLGTGTLTVDGRSAVVNSDGRIATNGVLALLAGALDNTVGTVTSAGAAGVTIGDLGNERGLLAAGGGMTLAAGAVRNTGGAIEAVGKLDARLGSLAGGTVVATGAGGLLALDVRGAITGEALAGATGDATIGAGSFALGGDARLTAGGTLTVTARDGDLALGGGTIDAARITLATERAIVTGNGGLIQSTDAATISAGSLVSGGGRVAAGGALSVAANTVDNRAGLLVSGRDGFNLNAGTLLNDRGTLGGDGAVKITAASLDNGSGILAAASDLRLTATNLTNATEGQIWADQDARVTVAQTLANRGSITAARDLIVSAGMIDGGSGAGSGTLAGGRLLSLSSGGGTAGRLIAPNALTLGITGDLTNAAGDAISTPGALTLTIGGSFMNAGTVEGGRAVAITTGGAIANLAGASIVAPEVSLTAGTTLENLGLINGAMVALRGAQITNGGALFGDRMSLFGAGGIVNAGESAVIATRSGLLSLASAGDIVNRDGALLYSLGDLSVTGADGSGRAGSLQNLSGDIQAQGNIAIAATRVVNNRAIFATEEALLSTREVEERDQRNRENRTITAFVETVTDTQVIADSGPARIIGGNITIDADSLVNNISTISATGDLSVGAAAVTNTAFTGFNTTTQNGTITDQRRSCFLIFCGGYNTRSVTPFNSVIALPTFTVPSTITAGGTLTIDAVTIDNLTLTPGGDTADIFAADASPGALTVGGMIGAAAPGAVTAPGGVPAAVAGSNINPEFGFAIRPLGDRASGGAGAATLDLGGLFRFADSSSLFLVEADPRFTNYNDFISSDIFLDRLGLDPARVQRRLGDGLYEQQLIANQLVALIGAQRIAGYGDNQAQYRALLEAGATYAQRYNLALGVGLSSTQMATLTSDIVLLVETVVQTPSGPRTVLAPRVYLTKASVGDLTSGGAIIAGRDLQLRASDSFANAGVVRASASSTIVGGTIVNSGRLDLGSRGIVSAAGDLIDRGGAITGGDLTLSAGRDLVLAPVETTRTVATRYYAGRSDQRVSLTTTTTNRGTDIAATGNVDLLAGRTVSATATTLAAAGDLTIYGGQNIAIDAATDSGTAFAIGRDGKTQFKQTQTEQTNILSDLRAGGDVTLITPGALTVEGGTIAAKGALVAEAGSIAVTGVVDSARLERETLSTSGGFLSSTKTTTRYDGTDQIVVASTLAGDTVALRSADDTRITGSNVVAENGVGIVAGGAIDIGTLAATDTEAQSTRVKKSGLSIGGGGLFVGVATTGNDVNTTALANTGSLIGSAAGDVTLDAGRDLTITGSQVAGTGVTRLTGESVSITNAIDLARTDTLSKSSSIGISVGIESPLLSGLQGVRDSARILGNDNTNARTSAVAGLAGGLAAYNAADALTVGGANVADTARNLTSVGVSFGVSKSQATSSTNAESVVGSRIAGNDVAIAARGAGAASTILVQSSEIVATRDLLLIAPGAITLRSARETDTFESRNRSSGFSIGVQIGLSGGITPSASLSLGRGNASGTDVRNIESILTAGDTLSISTPGALTLQGALASGSRVEIDAGSLAIISEQDRSIYAERQRNLGLSISAAQGGSLAGNLTSSRQTGDYLSVREQSGIYAGQGGFRIDVLGNTDLVAGVIASDADDALNRLTTGTLTASELANRERYSANSVSLGGGIGGVGKDADGRATTDTTSTPGSALPGLRTGLGNISATPPVALGASGRQSGVSGSAIAPGTIQITSGDAASRATAAAISRDTASANNGALIPQYDANKREEIALGFAAATELANQTGTFFANRATEEQTLRDQAALATDPAEVARLTQRADALRDTFGAGSAARIVATAVNGAAGGNVTGSFNSFIQASAVNVLQSLTVSQIKTLADGLGARNPNGSPRTNIDGSVVQTAQSEALRGALQALAGCAGAAAGGSGSCGSAALGASTSVALNLLLNAVDRDDPRDRALRYDAEGRPINQATLTQQEARSNLVGTIVAAISAGAGLDTGAALNAAVIETENNQLSVAGRINRASFVTNPTPTQLAEIAKNWTGYFGAGDGALVLQAAQGNEELAKSCLASSSAAGCGAVQRRLDGLRANFASDTIAALSGGSLDQQRALGQLGYGQITQLGEYKTAIDALSPQARAALIESLRTRDPNDASANILSFLVSPTTAVNLAANLALLEQSNVGRTVSSLIAIDLAFKRGFIEQGKDNVVGLATLIGQTVRFGADSGALGTVGDEVRSLYRQQFGTELPPSVAALLPSGLRGQATSAYLGELGTALSTYARTRASDPAKFEADVNYVVNKYREEFGAAHDRAAANGTLATFYAEVSGRVAFEMATIILPTKLAKLGRAGDAIESLADTSRAVDEAVALAKADNTGGLGGRGSYNPQQAQADLEARYGAENVTSKTLPPSNSRFPALAGTEQRLVTGERVVFDTRGFPIFDDISRYQTRITMQPGNRPADLRAATRDLRGAISEGRVDSAQFNPAQLAAITGGRDKIPGFTWHHHQDRGRMQLVPEAAHSQVSHIGSVSLNKGR